MTRVIYGKTNNPKHADIGVTGKPDSLFHKINDVVEDCKGKVSAWKTKQEKYYRLRMRVKKAKNYPFKDSSNLRMPTADLNIKKIKASIMQQIFGVSPIVQVVPSPSESLDLADKIEKFLDHLIVDVMDIKNDSEIGIDQSLEKGFYLAKLFWDLQIEDREEIIDISDLSEEEYDGLINLDEEIVVAEILRRLDVDLDDNVADNNIAVIVKAVKDLRGGKKKVKFLTKDVIKNCPGINFISPERVYVPTDSGWDVQKCTSVTVEFFMPIDTLKKVAVNRGYDVSVINKIDSLRGLEDEDGEMDKDAREGIDRMSNPSGLVKMWETYGMVDINNDGKKELAVVTSLPDFSRVIRKVRMDNLSFKYPLVKLFYEISNNRWFSHRGACELLEDMIKEIDVQHNMKIDGQTMRNAPMIIYRAGMVNPRMARVNPASAIPVQGLQSLDDTIRAINLHNPNTEYSYEREQQILETKIQEYVGQIDFGLQSQINRRQPRTLGEVEMQQSNAGSVFSLDSGHYKHSFGKIFQMIFELWSEFGPDSYEFNYFGQNSMPERIKLSKEEIQGKYTVKVRGTDHNTNPQLKIQKAQQIMLASTNEMLINMNVVGPQQAAEALKRMYQAMDIEGYETLVNMQPQMPPPPDPRTSINPDFEDLTDSEKAQVLNAYGVEADGVGREKKQVVKSLEKSAEIASMIGGDSGR